jgi:hypothetical protein
MHQFFAFRNLAATLLTLAAAVSIAQAAPRVDYNRQVEPLLERYCVGCHAHDEPDGGLDLESYQGLLAGGESGLAITPGVRSSSRLLLQLAGQLEPTMPPEGEQRPTPAEIETLATWIEQGASGPSGPVPLKRKLRVPHIDAQADVSLPVTAIAMAPDGQLQAVARFRQIDLLRDDQSLVRSLAHDLGKVSGLQFSHDGSRLLVAAGVAGAYGTAAEFAIETGELTREFLGHRDSLYAARYSPDEKIVATAGYDHQIILWDARSGKELRRLTGHNGAVYDLAFSPDSAVLVSACADETVKVWNVQSGERLDTLGQPEGEVLAVDVTPDGKHILAASADNRVRVWELRSTTRTEVNPLVAIRFVDESPLVDCELTPDGRRLVVLSQSGQLKVLRTDDWSQIAVLERVADAATDLAIHPDGKRVAVALLNGDIARRELPNEIKRQKIASTAVQPISLDLGTPAQLSEAQLRKQEPQDTPTANSTSDPPHALPVPRGATVSGVIAAEGESDAYRWVAHAGEVWAIDADAMGDSPLDPMLAIFDSQQNPVLRVRLQATQTTYFTFRGKDSHQSSDFRLFDWENLQLSEYLYSAGEVTRLWLKPRGPDSGFNVYPGTGDRWTYFGTTHTAHALGEPAYIVRPLEAGEPPLANGLPTFDVYYENDDDPQRIAGKNSRLLFIAPADGEFVCRIADTRGEGGDNYAYRLTIRGADPGFEPRVEPVAGELRRGTGREFVVKVNRIDGFDGPVTFDLLDLPPGVVANVPLTIEAGQQMAIGTLWVPEDAAGWEGEPEPTLVARATIGGRQVERPAGTVGKLSLGAAPSVIPSVQPRDSSVSEDEDWNLQVRRGETVLARVVVRRLNGFDQEISFGSEFSGRNATQGVYVDNIGLNGLLILANANEREFFLTADLTAEPGKRSFFLTAQVDGNVTTHPITVEVLP